MNLELKEIKKIIEEMNKNKQIEVLNIFKQYNILVSENKNGTFVNLSLLNDEIINKLEEFIKYTQSQDDLLEKIEKKKETVVKTFFKEDKDLLESNT